MNEASAAFWSDDQLDSYINASYFEFFREYQRKMPAWARRAESLTYTASAESVTFTVSDGTPWYFEYVEDQTNSDPGFVIPLTTDKARLHRSYSIISDSSIDGQSTVCYVEFTQTKSSGVFTDTCKVYLSPKPSSDRSLVIHLQLAPEEMTADTHTTGMPDFVERCVVLQAAIYARVQEESPHSFLDKELEKAKVAMQKNIRPLKRGPGRVRYDPSLYN